jgi:hypothetical protein
LERKYFNLKRFIVITALLVGLLGLPQAFAQYESEQDASIPLEHFYIKRQKNGLFRNLLSKLHWSLSTGYGGTAFKHELDGFGVIQQPDSLPKIFPSGTIFPGSPSNSGYSNWTNDVAVGNATQTAGSVTFDSTRLGFRSKTFSIPLKASVHVEFNRYRIGAGYSFDYTRIGEFKPITFKDQINSYSLDKSSLFMKHYFVMLGAMVYRYNEYALIVDANIGGYSMGKSFNKGLMKKGIYFNLGVAVEREFSEYFRVFVRPSYEIKGYKLNIPETSESISHKLNAFYINVGVTYRLPELRRCFLKTCHAQLNHAHGNREYRSRRHPFYKKQNPHYGENYPNLIKYKGKNKKKLNPY